MGPRRNNGKKQAQPTRRERERERGNLTKSVIVSSCEKVVIESESHKKVREKFERRYVTVSQLRYRQS